MRFLYNKQKRVVVALNHNRVVSLDIARACAALSVFLFHYGAFSFGYLGVELFFLISGFVLTLPSRHATALQFTWARCKRLYPAYWACMGLTLLALGIRDRFPSLPTVAANTTMFTAFLGQPYIDGVYWSLTEEIIFYALVAITASYRPRSNPLFLAATLVLVCVAHILLMGFLPSALGQRTKATMAIKYFPFFAHGITAAVLYRKFGKREAVPAAWLGVAACGLIFIPILTLAYRYSFHLPDSVQHLESTAIACVFLFFYAANGNGLLRAKMVS